MELQDSSDFNYFDFSELYIINFKEDVNKKFVSNCYIV